MKPEPTDFFPSSSENLASPVPGEIFKFYSANLWLPRSDFYIPSTYISFRAYLKKAKQRPDRKGQPGGNFTDPCSDVFSEKPDHTIDATQSFTDGCDFVRHQNSLLAPRSSALSVLKVHCFKDNKRGINVVEKYNFW